MKQYIKWIFSMYTPNDDEHFEIHFLNQEGQMVNNEPYSRAVLTKYIEENPEKKEKNVVAYISH